MSNVYVVNVLAKEYYDDCHIKGSINVPWDNLKEQVVSWNRETPVVVYCARYECHASYEAYKQLIAMGFKHVYEYAGGMAEWYQKGYPYEGVATQAYLKKETHEQAIPEDVQVITADALKKMMEN